MIRIIWISRKLIGNCKINNSVSVNKCSKGGVGGCGGGVEDKICTWESRESEGLLSSV